MKNALGEEAREAKKATGSGTKVAGYVDTPVLKQCRFCEYFVGKNLCRQKTMLKDKQVKTDARTKLKIVDPVNGCCSFWEANDERE